ncbi:MAG: hypothetical protein UT30_C0039G0005 [Candidatus Uhrbacteria bacterium GW2011_GWF2_39_13]|uniref:Uncharacterized protein n=1 Tax=Candidatus Uhrbacteria bacterium GW2011_GWF2_39_13 TaxID=1618995 RepID=A0A0G0MRL2_9BACT|nr:MAG: hypothetical protein UT30_C0039G0005 [Candidatus Uhrbacteria bacterium GW2011_GWF2_39_13]
MSPAKLRLIPQEALRFSDSDLECSKDQGTAEVRTSGGIPFTSENLSRVISGLRLAGTAIHGWAATVHVHVDQTQLPKESAELIMNDAIVDTEHYTQELRSFQAPTPPILGTSAHHISLVDGIGLEHTIRFGLTMADIDLQETVPAIEPSKEYTQTDLYRSIISRALFTKDPLQRASAIYLTYTGKLFESKEALSAILEFYKDSQIFKKLFFGIYEEGLPKNERNEFLKTIAALEQETLRPFMISRFESRINNAFLFTSLRQQIQDFSKISPESFQEQLKQLKPEQQEEIIGRLAGSGTPGAIVFLKEKWDLMESAQQKEIVYRFADSGTPEAIVFIREKWDLMELEQQERIMRNLAGSGTPGAIVFLKEKWDSIRSDQQERIIRRLAYSYTPEAIVFIKKKWDLIGSRQQEEIMRNIANSGTPEAIVFIKEKWESIRSEQERIIGRLAGSGTPEAIVFIKEKWDSIRSEQQEQIMRNLVFSCTPEAIVFLKEKWDLIGSEEQEWIIRRLTYSGTLEAIVFIKKKFEEMSQKFSQKFLVSID